jgi:flavin reductase (DIM6/NTAB) family NADH-FMN oxidoreductase RutF
MARQVWKPGTMVYPAPAVLVSCGSTREEANLITVAWAGTICTNPAMLSISVRPERHSYDIIRREMQFTVNLTTAEMARATDWCGVKSGRDFDKWKETGLTPEPGVNNTCFYVKESPLAIECRVKDIIALGSHHMFIAEVLGVLADDKYIDKETGAFDLGAAGMMAYSHGAYYALGEKLGRFGFSVMKKK